MRANLMSAGGRLVLSLLLVGAAAPALAWVYPEHRDIAVLGVDSLDAERRAEFDRLWAMARLGRESRLCEKGADTAQGLKPTCIDWAAWAAIAGDHSCSSQELVATVLNSDWILNVAGVAAQLKVDLANVPVTETLDQAESSRNLLIEAQRRLESQTMTAARQNALRSSDTRLQSADPRYATRAGANNAHFLLARPSVDTTGLAYAEKTLRPGSEVNAIGVYTWFHLSALQKATRLATEQLGPAQRQALALAILGDEAFALHFLEDAFASGHVAGTWGDASQRKGTHDFYNENGLEVFTWTPGNASVVLMGDAHMRPQDAQVAAKAVRASLEQVLDATRGRATFSAIKHAPAAPATPDAFDVCKATALPKREPGMEAAPEVIPVLAEVLRATPVPALGAGLGSVPRFRSEVGPFLGLASTIDVKRVQGGFLASQTDAGAVGGLDLSVRAGLGLDGVLGDAGDGLVFVAAGIRADTPSTNKFTNTAAADQIGGLAAAIPARIGISTRVRMPYYLIPGDLLLMAPLFLVAPESYASMAVTASNGGLIPWQSGWATGIGRFQFVLGRELGVTFYRSSGNNTLVAPATVPGAPNQIVQYASTSYDLPILEFRPYRSFTGNQSSSVLFQLFAGADVPRLGPVVTPAGGQVPQGQTVWNIGLRVIFDWRHYY